MSQEPQDTKAVEESDEDSSLFVVDPDDYQQTRKLKAINDAKDVVRKRRNKVPETANQDEWAGIHARIAESVALYGHELLPLIEDALDRGVLSEDDLETEYGSLRQFILYDGRLPKHEKEELRSPPPPIYMTFYRRLETIQRQLGLGLELQEDMGPAEI